MLKRLDRASEKMTKWIGTPLSVLIHTILFIVIFSLRFFNVSVEEILLILTTAVSLEAIYLSIFIQMSVNKTSQSLTDVGEDIEDIQEDVEDIQEDVDEIQGDVDDIQEDVEDITTDNEKEELEEDVMLKNLDGIEKMLSKLHKEIIDLKKSHITNQNPVNKIIKKVV